MNRKYLAQGSRIYGENCEEYPEAFNHSEKQRSLHTGVKGERKQSANTKGSNKTMTVKELMANEFLCLSGYVEMSV